MLKVLNEKPDRVNSQEILDIYEVIHDRLEAQNVRLTEKNKNMKNVVKTVELQLSTLRGDLEKERKRYKCISEKFRIEEMQNRNFLKKERELEGKIGLLEAEVIKERLRNDILQERVVQALDGAANRKSRVQRWYNSLYTRVRKQRRTHSVPRQL